MLDIECADLIFQRKYEKPVTTACHNINIPQSQRWDSEVSFCVL